MPAADEDFPRIEAPEPLARDDDADVASRDSEIDFDDEQEEDQRPIDIVEALEVDALLDDPEQLSDDDDE